MPTVKYCTVCEEVASGVHFGALTCNGCKSFFRRSIRLNLSYACAKGGGHNKGGVTKESQKSTVCPVKGWERGICKRCRLRKCIEMGMKPKAVQQAYTEHINRYGGYRCNSSSDNGSDSDSGSVKRKDSINQSSFQGHVTAFGGKFDSIQKVDASAFGWSRYAALVAMQSAVDEDSWNICRLPPTTASVTQLRVATPDVALESIRRSVIDLISNLDICYPQSKCLPFGSKLALVRSFIYEQMTLGMVQRSAQLDRKDIALLKDGMHYYPRAQGQCTSIIFENLIDPIRSEGNLDQVEYACLQGLAFWNSDVCVDAASKGFARTMQKLLALTLENYIETKSMSSKSRLSFVLLLLASVRSTANQIRDIVSMQVAHTKLGDALIDDILLPHNTVADTAMGPLAYLLQSNGC